jgi:hypothetical protein
MPGSDKHEKRRVSYSPDQQAAAAAEKARKGRKGWRKSRRLQCQGEPSIPGGTTGQSNDGTLLLQVVAFMTKEASVEINARGYSCHGCRRRGEDLVVGTLNQGGRMNPWCIKCFMARYSLFRIGPPAFHAPHQAVMYVNKKRREWFNDATADPMPTEQYQELRVTNHDVSMKLMFLGKPPGWGCKDDECERCDEMNSFLGTWIPEVKPWYGRKERHRGEGSGNLEGDAPSTPSGVAGSTAADGAIQVPRECPDTHESCETIPYEGELPAAQHSETYSAATLESYACHGDEIRRLLDNLGGIMKDIVRDRFWEQGASNELLARLSEAEGAMHSLRCKMDQVAASP